MGQMHHFGALSGGAYENSHVPTSLGRYDERRRREMRPSPDAVALRQDYSDVRKEKAPEKEARAMFETNQTELWRERQLALLREADDRRLARRWARRPQGNSRRAVAMWERIGVPFFRA
jgi:hypothetical protein